MNKWKNELVMAIAQCSASLESETRKGKKKSFHKNDLSSKEYISTFNFSLDPTELWLINYLDIYALDPDAHIRDTTEQY